MNATSAHSFRRRRTTGLAVLAALALLAAACADDGSESGTVDLEGASTPIVALRPFDSCDQLLSELKEAALEKVGPYGLDEVGPFLPMEGDVVLDEFSGADGGAALEAAPRSEATGGDDGGADTAVSGTNVQEEGVDEPDIVKADAERMVVVTNGRLLVIDLTGEQPEKVGRLDLPAGADHELLVDGDRAVVMSQDYLPYEVEGGAGALPDYGRVTPTTTVADVDLSDPTAPRTTGTLTLESGYVSARMVDGVIRIVTSRPAPDLGFVYPATPGPEGDEVATRTNRQVVEDSTLDQWLPGWTLDADGSSTSGRLDDCERVHRPAELAGFGLVSVLTVGPDGGLGEPDAVSVLGAADTVYASADHLYVSTERYDDPDEADPDDETAEPSGDDTVSSDEFVPAPQKVTTSIHRFATPGSDPVEYEASGSVEGRLLNQFSMSEHDDVLRVATTRGQQWVDESTDSLVTTLAVDGDRLVELGRVDGLGKGEDIRSVRFIGPLGYVVTFRQTDPLYVVDLTDPAAPSVSGELKILGYSAYLHPIDDTHLLGVGQDADEDGRTSGTQVSLFDVSDPADPTRTAQFTVPGGSSEVEWDHRAFLWWGPTGTAVIPLDQYDQGDYRTGALAVDVDVDGATISERGRLDTAGSSVRRSVVIGDTLASITAERVLFSALAGLAPEADVDL